MFVSIFDYLLLLLAVGTGLSLPSNLTPKDIPGLIRHNLHANKFCSKTALRIGDVARSSRPQKVLDLLRNNDSELASGRVLAKIG